MKKNNQSLTLILLLLLLSNFFAFLLSQRVGLYDPSIFKLQLEYPLLGLKPYVDFIFYYPFGLSLFSELIQKLSFGFLKLSSFIWPIHFILQYFFIKKISEVLEFQWYKNLVLIFLIIETFFYGLLGTEPFSLLITLIVLIDLYISEKNNKINFSLYFLCLILVLLRWDRFFYCECIFLSYLLLCRFKKINLNRSFVMKVGSLFITTFIIYLFIFFIKNKDNFFESLEFVFLFPFKINQHRSLDFHFDNMIFTVGNFFYFLLFLYGLALKNILTKTTITQREVFLSCSGLVMLPYCIARPDYAHLIPFYISSIFLVLFFLSSVKSNLYKRINIFINEYGFLVGVLLTIILFSFVTWQLSKPIINTCSIKGNYKTIFVGNKNYSEFVINAPLIYLNNLNLKPASRFISEDPGVQDTCKYSNLIVDELNRAEKPTIYFINTVSKKEIYNSNKLQSCGLIERYINQNTTIIDSCKVGEYEFEVRSRK